MLNTMVRFVFTSTLCWSASFASQIRVFNLAHVPKSDLSAAEAEVTWIFAQAGMEVSWAEGTPDDRASLLMDFSSNGASATGCKEAGQALELSVQLLPRAPRGVASGTLGFSLPCAKFGIHSTIFADRCQDVKYQTTASFSKVLAYAIAHEVGHVLLRSSEHSKTGLMRARWDRNDWVLATASGIPIDPEQARRMRLELSRMESYW